MFLKILYKALHKAKNRKEKAREVFATMLAFYIVIILFIISIFFTRLFDFIIDYNVYLAKVLLGILFMGGGFGVYKYCVNYANRKFEQNTFYTDINMSVRTCKIIYILWRLTGFVVFVCFVISL